MIALVEAALSNVLASAALALVAIGVGMVCRRPAVVHALWLLVLLKLVTPPLFRVPLPWPAPAGVEQAQVRVEEPARLPDVPAAVMVELAELGEEAPGPAEDDAEGIVPLPDPSPSAPPEQTQAPLPSSASGWQALLGIVWLGGSAAWFALAIGRAWRFTVALRQAKAAPVRLQARVAELARQLGLKRAPQVRLVQARVPPLIWAVGRPVLLLPEGLLGSVGEQGLDTLLAHELAHLRRRDHWLRWVECLVLGLFWWDPLAWYARQQMREAEEQCCDAWVVLALPEARRAYASALVDALDFLSRADAPPALATGVGPVADLKRRLTMILSGVPSPRLGLLSGLAIFALTGVLPLMPGWARADDTTRKEVIVVRAPQGGDVLRARLLDADAQKLEAELRAKLAEIEAIKKKIEATRTKVIQPLKAPGAGLTVRVEVSGLDQAGVKALTEAIQKAVPAGKDKKVQLSIDARRLSTTSPRAIILEKTPFKIELPHGKIPGHGTPEVKKTITIRYVDAATGKVIKEEVVGDKAPLKHPVPKKVPGRLVDPMKAPPKTGLAPKGPLGGLPGTGLGVKKVPTTEERLDRLEKQLDALIHALKSQPKQGK